MKTPIALWVAVCIFAVAIILVLIDQLLLWMERKGWIYYRMCEPKITGGARGVMGMFHEIVEPETRDVIEDTRQREAEIDRNDRSNE